MESTEYTPDKSKFKDSMGKYITQSLFLEIGYDVDKAVYTFKDTDYEYKGTVYPSLRRLYMETMDPTEYHFANKYLWGWEHWLKITENQLLLKEIEKWREELEVKIRAVGVRNAMALGGSNFTAAQWVANGKWKHYSSKGGRPTKQEQAKDKQIRERVAAEAESDAQRIVSFMKKEKTNG
jgi:hypothetical protein